jgi:hypothetical protein
MALSCRLHTRLSDRIKVQGNRAALPMSRGREGGECGHRWFHGCRL